MINCKLPFTYLLAKNVVYVMARLVPFEKTVQLNLLNCKQKMLPALVFITESFNGLNQSEGIDYQVDSVVSFKQVSIN